LPSTQTPHILPSVSAQLSALLGVAVGALLAGGSSLLLAWRDETIQGRTGVHLISEILKEAQTEVARLVGENSAVWKADQLPDSQLWSQYRPAVSARLPLATLQKIDKAMRTLDALNGAAARAWDQNAELERRVWDALANDNEKGITQLQNDFHPQRLDQAAQAGLDAAAADICAALTALEKATPSGRRDLSSFLPWCHWHWRSLAAGSAIAITTVVAVIGLLGSSTSPVSEVQNALSEHLGDPVTAACERLHDTEDSFSCVAVEGEDRAACTVEATADDGHRWLLVRDEAVPAEAGKPCAAELARSFFVKRQHEANCTAFFQTGKSQAVSPEAASKPGYLARLKAKLRNSENSPDEVPPVLLPDTTFTAGC